MGVLEDDKFKRAMRKVTACARERFIVSEELLEDARKQMDKSKIPAIAYPREMILPLVGRSRDDDTADSSITYCLNEKIRNDPSLRSKGVQIGYMTEKDDNKEQRLITFKRINWYEWDKSRKQRTED